MDIIPFTHNWNKKLDCKAFTTIRIYNPAKHYKGNKVQIVLKNMNYGTGEIMEVKPFLLKDLNPFMSYLDTGYSVDECKNIITTMYQTIDLTTKQLAFVLILKDKP